MDLDRLWPFQLTRGHSKDPSQGACLLDAVSWFEDGCLNDQPPCVSPVLASLGHFANDILEGEKRQELRRFIPRLVGTVDEKADRLRVSYLLFTCEAFARRWEDAHASYHSLERFDFWDTRVQQARDERMCSALRVGLLLKRLWAAQHLHGVHRWHDPEPIPVFIPNKIVPENVMVKFHEVTAREDVERIAVDLLDVCCAIGAPRQEWDYSRVPASVERFQRARETV